MAALPTTPPRLPPRHGPIPPAIETNTPPPLPPRCASQAYHVDLGSSDSTSKLSPSPNSNGSERKGAVPSLGATSHGGDLPPVDSAGAEADALHSNEATPPVPALTVTTADPPLSAAGLSLEPAASSKAKDDLPLDDNVIEEPSLPRSSSAASNLSVDDLHFPGDDSFEGSSSRGGQGSADDLEDEEIFQFLKQTSKQLQQIQLTDEATTAPLTPLPSPRDYLYPADPRRPGAPRRTNWVLFGYKYGLAFMDRNLPPSMVSPEAIDSFSLGRFRGAIERAYVAVPPPLWEAVLEGKIVDIYLWKDPERTARYLALYAFLWLFDLIPAFCVGTILFLLVDRRLRPPDAKQLRHEAERRRRVGEQASAVGHDVAVAVSSTGALGMLARGAMQGAGAPALAKPDSLMGSVGSKKSPSFSLSRPRPRSHSSSGAIATLARGSMQGAGAAAMQKPETLMPALELSPSITEGPKPSAQSKTNQPPKGLYSLGRLMMSRYGAKTQLMLNDVADLGEKLKNLYLWRNPRACWRTVGWLALMFFYFLVTPLYWVVKSFLLWCGFQFFGAWWFMDRHPRFRKAFGPWWWLLHGVPTDAEWVIEVLQERAKQHKPLRGKAAKSGRSKSFEMSSRGVSALRRHSRNESKESVATVGSVASAASEDRGSLDAASLTDALSTAGSDVPEKHGWKRWKGKLLDGGETVMRRAKSSDSFRHFSSPNSPKRQSSETDNKARNPDPPESSPSFPLIRGFAMLNGKAPGTLVVTTSDVAFEPIRGFRTAAAVSLDKLAEPPSTPPESVSLVEMTELVAVRKVKSFGLGVLGGDGLELSSRGKTVIRLSNVANRDEVFNEILGAASARHEGWSLAPH